MTRPYVTTQEAEFRTRWRRFGVGVMIGAALAGGLAHWLKSERVVDPRMEVACAMPRHEGELTLILVLEGKVLCWRYK